MVLSLDPESLGGTIVDKWLKGHEGRGASAFFSGAFLAATQDKGNEKETREKLEKLVDAQQMQADFSKIFWQTTEINQVYHLDDENPVKHPVHPFGSAARFG